MDPDFLLSVIAATAGFFLKSTLAFAACAALSRLAYSPRFRFVLWSGFVYGAAAYWLYLAGALWRPAQQAATAVTIASQPVASAVTTWQIPSSWAFPLALTLRTIGIAYSLALCYAIFAHLRKRHNLRWVLSFTTEPPADIAETFRSVAGEFHVTRAKLLILSGATSPATFGWFRPVVLLPGACLEENHSELEDILRHELQHVHRWDAVWNELAVAARGLLFFHPAVWYGVRKMHIDRELACDLAVVARYPARRAAYAECLVRFARLNIAPESSGWGIDFAASAQQLTVRVQSILADSKTSPGWMRCLRIASGVSISMLFLGMAPSLVVLLSFTHQKVSHSLFTSAADTAPSEVGNETRAVKRVRSFDPSVKTRRQVQGVDASLQKEDRPEMDLPLDNPPDTLSSQSSFGPQLHRRGDPSVTANKESPSQTIALVDTDAKGQPIKSGDSKQTIQQTATAALGVYKRVSSVDRH